MEANHLSRRAFIAGTLKSLIVIPSAGLTLGGYVHADELKNDFRELSPFIHIFPNGKIHLMIHKQEMGQGVRTSMAVLLAEELNVKLDQVRIQTVDCHPTKFGRMDTGGSGSVRRSWEQLRQAGASAREMLLTAAALRWGINKDHCYSENAKVFNRVNSDSFTYGELCTDAALLPVPQSPPLKSPDKYHLIGNKHTNLDIRDIVTGKAQFGIDACPPNTLYATVIRSPAAEGQVKSFDAAAALKLQGVIAVQSIESDFRINGNRAGVGIIAKDYLTAIRAREKLVIDWDLSEAKTNGMDGLYEYLESNLDSKAITVDEKGTPESVIGKKTITATYKTPPQSQAHIEPMVCVAEVKGDFCTLWVGHQFPQTVSKRVAEYLNIPVDNITLHPFRMGGSFGRKYENDFVMEAVQLAKVVDGPVKVLWSREDDMQFGFYQTPSLQKLECKLNSSDKPITWQHNSVTVSYGRKEKAPINAGDPAGCMEYMLWNIEHYRLLYRAVVIDINRGAHRSIGNVSAQFAIGSFQDEVAQKAGQDSISYFLEQLGKDRILPKGMYESWIADELQYDTGRLRKCIQEVAKISDWFSPKAAGTGMGFSAFRGHLTYCATVVKVRLVEGRIKVTDIWNVTDCGQVVDLSGAEQQVVGALTFGLSCALYEKIFSEDHQVVQSNFHQYPVARMKDIPQIKAEFINSNAQPTGLGEPAVSGVAPALANAIYQATGKRIRSLPFSDHIDFV